MVSSSTRLELTRNSRPQAMAATSARDTDQALCCEAALSSAQGTTHGARGRTGSQHTRQQP